MAGEPVIICRPDSDLRAPAGRESLSLDDLIAVGMVELYTKVCIPGDPALPERRNSLMDDNWVTCVMPSRT